MAVRAVLCFLTHRISVVFVDKDGKEQEVRAPLGKNLLEVAHDNEVDLEGEQSCSCTRARGAALPTACRPLHM